MKIKLLLFISTLITLTSCSTTSRVNTSKTMDIYGAGVIHKPVIVDLDVKDTKVTGTATANMDEDVKNLAVANALKESKADVLVEPKFEIEAKNGKRTATVIGYPATYKNFRPIKPEDAALLNTGIIQKANVYEPVQDKTKRKGRAGAAILTTLGLIGLTITLGLLL